jgi:hypothetical protein
LPNYFYNGVELPALPETHQHDSTRVYDYVVIFKNLNTGDICAAFCTSRWSCFKNKYTDYVSLGGHDVPYYVYVYDLNESGEWEDRYSVLGGNPNYVNTDGGYITGLDKGYYQVIWSNQDILNEDGSVYLPASDPKPLPTPQDFYIVKNGVGQKQDVYLRVGGQSVKLDEYLT